MPSRAEQFFTQIKDSPDRAAAIRRLVTDRMAEEEYVEFKNGAKMSDDQIKAVWSEALSGFANTEGGVLIFGIKTGRVAPFHGGRAIDTAVGFDLVPHPDQLVQLLRDTLLNSTVERINGVQHLAVKEAPGDGFVVSLVPEGNHKPYRAQTAEHRYAYYQRIGDSFEIISHSLLRSMFYPQSTARLEPKIKLDRSRVRNIALDMTTIQGSLLNSGRRSASNVSIRFQTNKTPEEARESGRFVRMDTAAGSIGFQTIQVTTDLPIHPGEHLPVFEITYSSKQLMGVQIRITIYLDNQEPSLYRVFFGFADSFEIKSVESFE